MSALLSKRGIEPHIWLCGLRALCIKVLPVWCGGGACQPNKGPGLLTQRGGLGLVSRQELCATSVVAALVLGTYLLHNKPPQHSVALNSHFITQQFCEF